MVRISILADKLLVRECLQACLVHAIADAEIDSYGSLDEWTKTGTRSDITIAIQSEPRNRHSVSFATIRELLALRLGGRVILIHDVGLIEDPPEARVDGVDAIIPMTSSIDVILLAVKSLRRGGQLMSPGGIAAGNAEDRRNGRRARVVRTHLTPTQLKIVKEMQKGSSNRKIAFDLRMNESTVKVHIRHIFRRLNVNNRTAVVLRTHEYFVPPAD